MPGPPPPYGVAGWTTDDKFVLLYDRYDVWQIAPDGSSARNMTAGLGRKEKLLKGLDAIGETLQAGAQIDVYEARRALDQPWLETTA